MNLKSAPSCLNDSDDDTTGAAGSALQLAGDGTFNIDLASSLQPTARPPNKYTLCRVGHEVARSNPWEAEPLESSPEQPVANSRESICPSSSLTSSSAGTASSTRWPPADKARNASGNAKWAGGSNGHTTSSSAGPGDVLVGHNLQRFDRPALAKRRPDSPLLDMPTLDTLELSVLAFPRRPYHRLVKDDRLVRDARPNPVSDVRASERVLEDAIAAWEPSPLIPHADIVDHARRGWRHPYEQNGWPWRPNDPLDLWTRWHGRVCTNSPRLSSNRIDMALVMLHAWLGVPDEAGSVLPRWVRETWPEIRTLARDLRATACQDPSCAWCTTNLCPDHWLREVFGFDTFREQPALGDGTSLQRDLVARGLRDQSTFGILPTGGGKSLCFQVPAEARHRLLGQLTAVISPLQSLMKDQVDSLQERIPHARAISARTQRRLPFRASCH
jgi:hypothetical protein